MPLERALRLVAASERAIRERERVVRRAPLGKQRDRALEVRDRFVVAPFAPRQCVPVRARPPAPQAGSRRSASNSCWLSIEVAGFEQRFGELHARRQIVRRDRQRLLEPRGGLGVPREALQHNRVEVVPGERSRRQRLGARVGLVRGLPLLPGVQQAGERADGLGVVRTRGGVLVRARERVASRRWKRIKREAR